MTEKKIADALAVYVDTVTSWTVKAMATTDEITKPVVIVAVRPSTKSGTMNTWEADVSMFYIPDDTTDAAAASESVEIREALDDQTAMLTSLNTQLNSSHDIGILWGKLVGSAQERDGERGREIVNTVRLQGKVPL